MGFKELGNEKVLQYIDEQYAIAQQCTSDDKALQKRLKGYEALKVGNIAPEIVLTSNDGKPKTLKDFPHEAVVIVFWASWCPHCMEEMPKLQEWAKNNPSTLVLAVSLDDEYTAFQNAIKDFPNMLHNCDLQKWKGQIVSDYYIAATPTLMVLDQNRNIDSKWNGIISFINSKNE
jgi:thiol-disulfide isomerase/thioredoxin